MSGINFPNFFFPSTHSTSSNPSTPVDFDELEYLIAKKLEDPQKAEIIRKIYEKNLPTLSKVWAGFKSVEFQGWLVSEAKFLGALSVNHLDLALKSFPVSLLRDFNQPNGSKDRVEAMNMFAAALQEAWGKNLKETITLPQANVIINPLMLALLVRRTVVVLTRNCGNGHNTASQGIKQFLEKKGFNVHIINGSDYSHNMIVNSKFSKFAISPICSTELMNLRDRVKQLHPDVVINTVAHHNKWNQIAYDLEVPMLVVHTDYEVHDSVVEDDGACKNPCQYDNSSLIQYCIPHEHNEVNKCKMRNLLSAVRYDEMVKEMGFPVRAPFQRETDQKVIMDIRNELGFNGDERALLMLGHREPDTTTMIELIKKLRSTNRSFSAPLCIVAVCGNDPAVRIKLENALKTIPTHPDIRIKIEGYLDDEKMAKYMKAASRVGPFPGLMVSKRGGSTTAEATEMGVYTINLASMAQEECNGQYTKRHGLGEPYDPQNFLDQVSTAIRWNEDRSTVYRSPFDWRNNLMASMSQKIYQSVLARLGGFQFVTSNKP